jgi:ABC-2 type transport system permease protein
LKKVALGQAQRCITNGFDSIVLYESKTLTATFVPTADRKHQITLTVEAHKVKADGNGNETPMLRNDYIEIGVLKGKKDEDRKTPRREARRVHLQLYWCHRRDSNPHTVAGTWT